ncbi:MAG: single-stranded DNA-binding protein [Methylacidiphilales bacterium]|nr:single-stranded DNA-binding protein [Candidatus Methylacidiphilales bacterium]
MANFNKVLLMGNLTRDPEVRYTPKGTAVGDLGLAINDSYKAQDGTIKEVVTYVDIEVWGRQAETCKQYLTKGRPVFVEGQLKLDTWEQDGQKKSKLRVRADRVQFLGGGPGRSGGGGEQRSSSSAPTETGRTAAKPPSSVAEDSPPLPSDDDIPF